MPNNFGYRQDRIIYAVVYTIAKKIDEEPAFILWAKDALWVCVQTILKIKSFFWKNIFKFCVLIPKTVKEALHSM